MTDFSHHTPKVLTEADAAADLAGLPRAVSSEEAREHVDEIVACLGDDAAMLLRLYGDGLDEVADNMDAAGTLIAALVSERDALAGRVTELETEVDEQCRINGMGAERELALMGRVRELEAERDAAAKRAPDFAEFVDETDSTLEMVKRTFGNRGTPPDMLEGFATLTMVEQLLKRCEQVRAALTPTPESKP